MNVSGGQIVNVVSHISETIKSNGFGKSDTEII